MDLNGWRPFCMKKEMNYSEVNHLLPFDIKLIVPLKDLNKIISNYLKFWQLYEK